jgi:hypothetical protein
MPTTREAKKKTVVLPHVGQTWIHKKRLDAQGNVYQIDEIFMEKKTVVVVAVRKLDLIATEHDLDSFLNLFRPETAAT